MTDREQALRDLTDRVSRAVSSGDGRGLFTDEALQEMSALREAVDPAVDLAAAHILGAFHWARYQVLPEGADREELEAAVRLFEPVYRSYPQAVPAALHRLYAGNGTPDADETDPIGTANRGVEAMQAFYRTGRTELLVRAVDLFRSAEAAARDHPNHAAFATNLGNALRTLSDRVDQPGLLEEALALCRVAASETPPGHPNRMLILPNLQIALQEAFERSGDTGLLLEAVAAGREVAAATAPDDPDRAARLFALVRSLQLAADRTGDASCLVEAVPVAREAIVLTAPDHADRIARMSVLASMLEALAPSTDDGELLAEAVAVRREAAADTRLSGRQRAAVLSNLGFALCLRYDRTAEPALVREAVAVTRQALDAEAEDNPDRANNLTIRLGALVRLFDGSAEAGLLEEAVALGREAVRVTPIGDPRGPDRSSNLASVLQRLFERTGELELLREAVDLSREAARGVPEGHRERSSVLSTLGANLSALFGETGESALIEEAAQWRREVVRATPPDAPAYVREVVSLVGTLRMLHESTQVAADLAEAVDTGRQAMVRASAGSKGRVELLMVQHGNLRALFERTGEIGLLEETVAAGRELVAAVPAGAADRADQLSNLTVDLLALAERSGTVPLLQEAVTVGRTALAATPGAHPNRGTSWSNLGVALHQLYESTGELALLTEAVSAARQAVADTPPGHERRPAHLTNLSTVLRVAFARSESIEMLREGAEVAREAAMTVAADHPERANYFSNLESVLMRLSATDGDAAVEGEALAAGREAVRSAAADHPRRGRYLSNHAGAHAMTFDRTRDPAALERAADLLREAMEVTPAEHSQRASSAANLARVLETLATLSDRPGAVEEAAECYAYAARHPGNPVSARISAHRALAGMAVRHGWSPERSLAAMEAAVRLLPQLTPRHIARSDREQGIAGLVGISGQAAATAMNAGRPEQAVELLEQTRGVLVADVLDARSGDLAPLRGRAPELAARFAELRAAIEKFEAAGDDRGRETLDALRGLQGEWDALLERIRGIEGLADFLSAPDIHALSDLSRSGPIVMIYTSEQRCDALVLVPDAAAPVMAVELPDLTSDETFRRTRAFIRARGIAGDPRAAPAERVAAQDDIHQVLQWLWDSITEPVLDALGCHAAPAAGEPWPRVWWCPVGILSFLPLHAAGYHPRHGTRAEDPPRTVLDRVVSSYTATVRALAFARAEREGSVRNATDSTLIVAEPGGGDIPYLAGVEAESRALAELIPQARLMEQPARQDVLTALHDHVVVHFACHGQAGQDPSTGRLILRDYRAAPLSVKDISGLRLNDARLAYLSACETSLTSPELADEAIHITSAFQLAGYRHVIGTLWPIDDAVAARIAVKVYTRLTRAGTVPPDSRLAAEALHHALREIRDAYPAAATLWTTHIHTGA